jgi:hypothetical protein
MIIAQAVPLSIILKSIENNYSNRVNLDWFYDMPFGIDNYIFNSMIVVLILFILVILWDLLKIFEIKINKSKSDTSKLFYLNVIFISISHALFQRDCMVTKSQDLIEIRLELMRDGFSNICEANTYFALMMLMGSVFLVFLFVKRIYSLIMRNNKG